MNLSTHTNGKGQPKPRKTSMYRLVAKHRLPLTVGGIKIIRL